MLLAQYITEIGKSHRFIIFIASLYYTATFVIYSWPIPGLFLLACSSSFLVLLLILLQYKQG